MKSEACASGSLVASVAVSEIDAGLRKASVGQTLARRRRPKATYEIGPTKLMKASAVHIRFEPLI
jgi:hypothetical protein